MLPVLFYSVFYHVYQLFYDSTPHSSSLTPLSTPLSTPHSLTLSLTHSLFPLPPPPPPPPPPTTPKFLLLSSFLSFYFLSTLPDSSHTRHPFHQSNTQRGSGAVHFHCCIPVSSALVGLVLVPIPTQENAIRPQSRCFAPPA